MSSSHVAHTPSSSNTILTRASDCTLTVSYFTQRKITIVVTKSIKFVPICYSYGRKDHFRPNYRYFLTICHFNNSSHAPNSRTNYHSPYMHVAFSLIMNEKNEGKSKSIPMTTKLIESKSKDIKIQKFKNKIGLRKKTFLWSPNHPSYSPRHFYLSV